MSGIRDLRKMRQIILGNGNMVPVFVVMEKENSM